MPSILNAVKNGGPAAEKIEPVDPVQFLEELENWADVLNNEPEALRLLTKFAAEASEGQVENEPVIDLGHLDKVVDTPEPSP